MVFGGSMGVVVPYEDPQYLEAVYAALFALLSSAPLPNGLQWNTKQRLVQVPDQISDAGQPALLQVEAAIEAEQKQVFGPVNWRMKALALVYFQADGSVNPSILPVTTANRFIWALAGVLGNTQPPYQKQTLGGLVYHTYIEGGAFADVIEQQVVITAPITIIPGPYG